jgi:hypothetical protein
MFNFLAMKNRGISHNLPQPEGFVIKTPGEVRKAIIFME